METDWTKHWEEFYGSFLWKFWVWEINRAYKNLLKNVSLTSPKVLELGSGSGINSLIVAKILGAKEVTLVDSNEKALEISKKLFERSNLDLNVRYVKRDFFVLDLEEKFDLVHSEGLIEHFYGEERAIAFKKHVDFCKEDGFIIIFVPHKSIRYNLLKWVAEKLNKWIYKEEPFSRRELYNLCKQFNLRVIKEYTFPLMHEIGILAVRGS